MAASANSRQYPTAYKLKAIKRAEGGEGEAHGPEGLNRKRGPKPGPRKLKPLQAEENKRTAFSQASARIVELERLVGRQQLDIDFFRKALRALERPAAQGKPASASSKSLKP